MKEHEIIALLRNLHDPAMWVFAARVATTTGYAQPNRSKGLGGRRFIDAFAMALWPSMGYERVAYEIKTTRADWLAELKNPAKRAQGYFLSNKFWYVLPEGIHERGDWNWGILGCGLLEVCNGGLIEKRKAVPRPAWPMPEDFVASFLRGVRASSNMDDSELIDHIARLQGENDLLREEIKDLKHKLLFENVRFDFEQKQRPL